MNGVTVVGTDYPDDVVVVMNVMNGIKNVYVKIDTNNSTFNGLVTDMGLVNGDGMDLASDEAHEPAEGGNMSLSSLFSLPDKDATTYRFEMNNTLFGLLNMYEGTHNFMLTVVDSKNNSATATLTITMQ